MALNPIFKITIVKGEVIHDNRERFEHFLQGLNGIFELIIRKPFKPRSNKQNKYFHGVIVKLIAEGNGWTGEYAKLKIKEKLLIYEDVEGRQAIRKTSELSTKEMEDFHEDCRRWAATDMSIDIPLPNEVDYKNYDEQV